MIPKTYGTMIMIISAFTDQVLGFSCFMTPEELVLVNSYRRNKDYISKDTSMKLLYGSTKKGNIESMLFICFFGITAIGTWPIWQYKWKILSML